MIRFFRILIARWQLYRAHRALESLYLDMDMFRLYSYDEYVIKYEKIHDKIDKLKFKIRCLKSKDPLLK